MNANASALSSRRHPITPAFDRRTVLKAGAALCATASLANARVLGANGQLRVGVIGTGVRGKYLIANMPKVARVVSLCDCSLANVDDTRNPVGRLKEPLEEFSARDARECSVYQDYRTMLDNEKLDAVVIAAPDHHHAQAMILACQAGLDVYCEKPLAVTIAEGRAMVNAAKKYDRVVQVGSQQRTMQINRIGCEFIRAGGLGKISHVQLKNFPGPMPYDNRFPAEAVPKTLAWDLFCGPTEPRPHSKKLWVKDAFKVGHLTWRGWDLFRDYSGHLMTNWGAHSIDMVQYALGMDGTGPVEVWTDTELLEAYDREIDDRWHEKTPPLGTLGDPQTDRMRFCPVSMRYSNGPVIHFDPTVRATIFHGERGKLTMSRNNYRTEPAGLAPPIDPLEQARWKGDGHVARPHLENWVEAIQTRGELNAPVEVGHRTATVCHLGNIVRELGRHLRWNPKDEQFEDDDEANRLISRPRRAGFELPS
jgi:predicted dehydrogenase